jgi:hypothetical protein
MMMKKLLLIFVFASMVMHLKAQDTHVESNQFYNVADKLLQTDGKLMIGGYGEVHYNQPLSGDIRNNGVLDVHRVVLLFGYNFNEKTQFITEVEYEHVIEVYIEQAFIQHKINPYLNFRAGLMLIPMGIVNEYHEPNTFNGVERPTIDNKISPSTWREIGFGFTGNILEASLKYQAYLVNGFNGYDGSAKLNGNNGLRSGRQKGAESYMSSPNFSGKVEYYGIRGLNFGLSGYFGDTQSKLYHKVSRSDAAALAKADSSVVGISMLGLDGRYSNKALQLRGQVYYTSLSNTDQYNRFTAKDGKLNDLGSSMFGYYLEAGYNVLRFVPESNYELIPFVRLEAYNTHLTIDQGIAQNKAYQNNLVTTGLTLKLAQGVVVKSDLQFSKSAAASKYSTTFNAGFGVMF